MQIKEQMGLGSWIEAGRRHRWVPGVPPPSSLPLSPLFPHPLKWSRFQDGAPPHRGVGMTPSCFPCATPSLTARATSLLPRTAPFHTCCSLSYSLLRDAMPYGWNPRQARRLNWKIDRTPRRQLENHGYFSTFIHRSCSKSL